MKVFSTIAALLLATQAVALSIGGQKIQVERDNDVLQNIVCYTTPRLD